MAANPQSLEVKNNVSKAQALLHSLVPRAQCFCYYDNARDCGWSSDGVQDHELHDFITELPDELIEGLADADEPLRRSLPSGRIVIILPVDGRQGERLGMLVALFSKDAGKSASFNPGLIRNILVPAIDVIAESLHIASRLGLMEREVARARAELDIVYDIDEKIHGARTRQSSLGQLVGQSGRFLGIGYSVLMIPSKRIRISATHSSWKNVNRKVLNRYLVEQLFAQVEGERAPVIFQIPSVEGSDVAAAHGYEALLSPLLDSQDNVEGVLAQIGRVEQQPFKKSDIRFMANVVRKVTHVIDESFDTMTGFMNRSGFEDQLNEVSEELEPGDEAHQLIYFDLDNLQLVNDTFGREAGDEVIMRVARLLEQDLPKTGVVSRLAGDEFCMLLTRTDLTMALDRANKIREQSGSLRYLEGDKSLQVTMSIGVAELNYETNARGSALTHARMACQAAKDRGRDRVEVYDEDDQSILRRYDDMQLVSEIQRAIDGQGLELMAQPIKCLTSKNHNPRCEVLLRMVDSHGERVDTGALFSAAERYRLMPQIDRWVVSSTIATLVAAREQLEEQSAVISINLSGQSLGDKEILEFIEGEIKQSGLSPGRLCFEITESAAVAKLDRAQVFIDRLRQLGCGFSLDDFGAGLSSFAYLKNFKVDMLKIDGGFVHDITTNRISESMVAAITQVAKVMELETVAEYVEDEATRELVASLGVDYAQGHSIGRPVPIREALASMSETSESRSD
ncbi:MAG: EAL domain-containing protein [Gammaproteobacteria bacterium]|nr:EAL domain-containing protein [Gammaproteobacteria bacterium]NNF49385.1 EAL domain-containing protein [Woeseiaceae bacterium]MBT8093542.1 EAL domain-containing protein [Gammaproteobacteria bacterium]MBT8106494.1 EAL domain-containing protein [Gammaproteobacteria bacterium]NNK26509.1 EAL domain-containing protein [Woeseiaceae bacterium]